MVTIRPPPQTQVLPFDCSLKYERSKLYFRQRVTIVSRTHTDIELTLLYIPKRSEHNKNQNSKTKINVKMSNFTVVLRS